MVLSMRQIEQFHDLLYLKAFIYVKTNELLNWIIGIWE